MRHILFEQSDTYSVAVLLKPQALNLQPIKEYYADTLETLGVPKSEFLAITMDYTDGGKASASTIKEYIDRVLPELKALGVKYLYVTDGAYFKALTKQQQADKHIGYVMPCAIKGFEDMSVVLGVNYQALSYKPDLVQKLLMGLECIANHSKGQHTVLGSGIVHSEYNPSTLTEIQGALDDLHKHPILTVDIEAFSLDFFNAGIGTISFAWTQHDGIAFMCDYAPAPMGSAEPGMRKDNPAVRAMIKKFFEDYKGKVIWHNSPYDVKVLIYTLWMKDFLDMEGLIDGLEVMTKDMDDTKVIAYLALNSCARNSYGLKDLAHAFAGNWANTDIHDIKLITPDDLLRYNLIDSLSTRFVYDTYLPRMIEDNQLDIYQNLMMPSQKMIIQMELCGMPMNMETVKLKKKELEADAKKALDQIFNNPVMAQLNLLLKTKEMEARQSKLKKKILTLDDIKDSDYNPNSGPQTQVLLYEVMGLPVIDFTDTKQPATGDDTLKKLINHTDDPTYKELIQALRDYSKVSKILSSFMPAFEQAYKKEDGWHYLHGSFNLGGTVSGRLSSSSPNLQNLPANSKYGKPVKECFEAPPGWIFAGADFNSLEDYISALTTKDPNKLKVYTDGFDGHCLRAAYYFAEQLPDIDPTDVASVNSIAEKYAHLRQESKTPTFALTYAGSYITLMNNLGWTEEKAKRVEAMYHALYTVSDAYIQTRLEQASKDGYVDVAFGLRVRTPLVGAVMWNSRYMPYEAAAEGRTAGNAMGQSYGLLNNRAAIAFMEKVRASKYKYDIKLVALIHDAIYLMIRDDPEVVKFANDNLVKEMSWQELPEIQHSTVKIGAALDLFWPTWAQSVTLPINAEVHELKVIAQAHKAEMLKKSE